MSNLLTWRQLDILCWIEVRVAADGYPPTVREIGAHFGIRSTNGVQDHLRALQRKGRLRITPGKCRAMQVLPPPEAP